MTSGIVAAVVAGSLATLKLSLLGLVGAAMYQWKLGDQETITHLSKFLFMITLPMLVFTSVGSSVSWDRLQSWYLIPLFCSIEYGMGALLGWCIGALFKVGRRKKLLISVFSGVNNTVALPSVYMVSLCSGNNQLSGQADCSDRAIAYLTFTQIVTSFYCFGMAYRALVKAAPEIDEVVNGLDADGLKVGSNLERIPLEVISAPIPEAMPVPKLYDKLLSALHFIRTVPPVWSLFPSILVGLIRPVQRFIFSHDEPMQTIVSAMKEVGRLGLTLNVFILGRDMLHSFYQTRIVAVGPPGSDADRKTSDRNPIELIVAITCVVRLVIVPGLYTPIVYWFDSIGLFPKDKVFVFCLYLLGAQPPAFSLVVLTRMVNNWQQETAAIMFYTYLLAIPLMSAWIALFLRLI